MSKGKDISTMFTKKKKTKRTEGLDMDWPPEKRKVLSVRHSTEHSCRKEVGEDE